MLMNQNLYNDRLGLLPCRIEYQLTFDWGLVLVTSTVITIDAGID